MDIKAFETRIQELLRAKLERGETDFLRGFYQIKGLYDYSIFNRILIWAQGGTVALGFHRWNNIQRHVKKGEHARIEILVPIIKTQKDSDTGETDDKCVGFITRKVFDISQTDGKPLEYANNNSDVIKADFDALRAKLADALKLDIKTEFTGKPRGYFDPIAKKIAISEISNNTDKIRTLFHEIGHAILHGEPSEDITSDGKEVEAELVANLVCEALGVEFKSSEIYIKCWNKTNPNIRILKVISTVQRVLKIVNNN